MNTRFKLALLAVPVGLGLLGLACGNDDGTGDGTGTDDPGTAVDCSNATTHMEKVVCATNGFLGTLSTTEKATAQLDFSNKTAKTTWSNLPNANRNGLKFGNLSTDQKTNALAVARAVLTDAGYEDFRGVLAADDYLATQGGGSAYSSANYSIAVIGTPSTAGNWMLQLGGHHMAYNITYLAGVGYPVPHHLGVEPKTGFTVNSETYGPLMEEGQAMVAVFNGLSSTQLDSAYLTGTFSDVVVGPDNGSGTKPTSKYPTGSNRTGVLVSALSSDQQAAVKAAIEQWVRDYDPAIADTLLTEYTSASALADTYIAWSGTKTSGPNPDVSGTYFRIDGPRLWIEVACQGGVVIRGQTHYHTIFRDKQMDYGNAL